MIASTKILKKYCEDYNNIENYTEAVKSPLRYDLHHRLEISENKSRKDLIDENLYYGRPPEELIFLEHKEHVRLHKANLSEDTRQKISENNSRYWKGKNLYAETRQRMSESKKGHLVSEETKQKMSESNCRYWKGKLGPNRGKHWHLEDGHRIWTD